MRGRKPIPSNIHVLQGGVDKTHRSKDHRADEPTPEPKIPACPRHLDKLARKEWRRMARLLSAVRILTEMDMGILASYCQAYSLWAEACIKVNEMGMVAKGPAGIPIINPYIGIAEKANVRMMRAAMELGATPVSRPRVHAQPQPKKNKIQEFMSRKNGTEN